MSETAISRITAADAERTHARYPTWPGVLPFPPESLMWAVGASSLELFLVVGDAWAQVIQKYLPPHATVVDIGCGCGRSARMFVRHPFVTRYIGFDVIPEAIAWCNRFLGSDRAEFHCYDLYSKEYNPDGVIDTADFQFPCPSGEADVIFAASVFTHLLEPDTRRYLAEVGRTLSPRGIALLSIHNAVPPGVRYQGTETRIDMDPAYFVEMAREAGLEEAARMDDLGGQQVFILKRSS